MTIQDIDKTLKQLEFDDMPCSWADAMWEDGDLITIECIIIKNDAGKQFFRLFAVASGILEDGGDMTYTHSFVKTKDEIKQFVKRIRVKFSQTIER